MTRAKKRKKQRHRSDVTTVIKMIGKAATAVMRICRTLDSVAKMIGTKKGETK